MKKYVKGDNVFVRKGKDRGKTGKILAVYPREQKIVVEGINLRKRHIRPRRAGQKGQIVQIPGRIFWANILVVCPNCKKPSRIGVTTDGSQKKRVCNKCKVAF